MQYQNTFDLHLSLPVALYISSLYKYSCIFSMSFFLIEMAVISIDIHTDILVMFPGIFLLFFRSKRITQIYSESHVVECSMVSFKHEDCVS